MDKKSKNTKENLRVGVFICDCGSNIAGHLDCSSVTEYAGTLPGVVFTKENLYTCSESGIVEIKKAIEDNNLNRVVVASCSPRTHHPLFASSCAEAGLNPYLFEMVNIRDQCSWVHMGQRDIATSKAKDLVRMGVAKSTTLEPQDDIESSLTRKILIIGGGIAGLSAAEALTGMGLEVLLVEKAAQFGGLLRNLHQLENGQSAEDYISDLAGKVASIPGVTPFTSSKVTEITGYIGNFAVTIETENGKINETVGCIVVATGAVPLIENGLLGHNGDNVITQMELEQQFRTGSFKGTSVTMIQCAGARNDEREYCSRICCLTAVKNAMYIKSRFPLAQVNVIYRDMQMYGDEKEQLLWDARGMGIHFHVYDGETTPEVGNGKVTFEQAVIGTKKELKSDLVVLSTPLVAREDAADVAGLMRVPTDKNGFFLEAHAKLRPLDFAADGIFICGSARYPATSIEARTQGLGVASRIGAILFKDKLVKSAIVAEILEETCVGCMGCLNVCPYDAITYNRDTGVCEVKDILCKGCGNCASTCPSHSAILRGYKPEQILAQIRAI
ncbi:CoB--CoM heterodisulfide reductase iron-sulfur subunit A family protein [Desulfopila sp. IMCC35008]|uniref:CoB--CoM heterodisulfide reductase iron-sulfur subunit A family protein n=1 Tax=Desulfopila sp. IMCC35008 TaxID=2653858 RepID=UPI00197AEFC0|nr:FAD-dependent oxidoreductase [Desulfopila sp. IMCC35008]